MVGGDMIPALKRPLALLIVMLAAVVILMDSVCLQVAVVQPFCTRPDVRANVAASTIEYVSSGHQGVADCMVEMVVVSISMMVGTLALPASPSFEVI